MTFHWIEDQLGEIEALQAIFEGEGELEIATPQRLEELRSAVQNPDKVSRDAAAGPLSFSLATMCQTRDGSTISIRLGIDLPSGYPSALPAISVSSASLSRRASAETRAFLLKTAEQLVGGGPMVMDLIVGLKEHIASEISTHSLDPNKEGVCGADTSALRTCLLRLDHMHSKQRYSKTIVTWCAELRITGRLVFQRKLILILLEGESRDVHQYLSRHRTVAVDIDSAGRDCKERMMSVLCDCTEDVQERRWVFVFAFVMFCGEALGGFTPRKLLRWVMFRDHVGMSIHPSQSFLDQTLCEHSGAFRWIGREGS